MTCLMIQIQDSRRLGQSGWSQCLRVDIGHKAIAEVLPSFLISGGHSAALFCQDLLAKSTIFAEDLNLCIKCDKSIAGHPPKTCGLVNQKLNQLFSRKRAEFLESYRNQELAFDKSPKKMGISLKKKF